jgi:indole-3-acetate monooxygenase
VTSTHGRQPSTADQLIQKLEAQTDALREQARESDRRQRLPEQIVQTLVGLGLFRLWIPKRYDGLESALVPTLAIYEAAARIDGSIGWAVMIGAGGGLFAAYLDPAAAGEIFAPSEALIAGSGAPDGRAEQEALGYRVTGRWRYASGAHYATTFTANCQVTAGGKPVLDASGQPLIRAMAFTLSQVTIVPNWNTTGMRGTGSHDFEVRDALVPERRTFSVFTDAPRESGILYRLPFSVLTELPVTAVAIGIARHALDAFATLARRRKPHGGEHSLVEDPSVQAQYARSHARWYAARATLYALAEQAWRIVRDAQPLGVPELGEITACCSVCIAQLQAAVGDLAALAGMRAITEEDAFARAWRDLQTLAAHASVSPLHGPSSGRALLQAAAPD